MGVSSALYQIDQYIEAGHGLAGNGGIESCGEWPWGESQIIRDS